MNHKLIRLHLATVLLLLSNALTLNVWAQFKKVYEPDSVILGEPSMLTAVKIMETDIPGKELMIAGTLSTQDSGGIYRLAAYQMLINLHGVPQSLHIFEDTSQFVFQGPRVYGACYAGNGEFGFAMGTNSNQVIMKTDTSGQMIWAKKARHHEFYSMLCEGSTMVCLGQDESIQGAHDFQLQRLNGDGSFERGKMYGTPEFENPQKVAKIGGSYLMVGNTFQLGGFELLVVKADNAFDLQWGHSFTAPGKTTLGYGIVQPLNGSGYVTSGTARGGIDSLFLFRIAENGTPGWARFYSIEGATETSNLCLAVDPESGGYLLAGSYRKSGYLRPFIFKTDSLGIVEWAWDYGAPGVNSDEFINDVIYCQADGYFYAVGDVVDVDSNQYLHKVLALKIAADSGSVPCDSALVVSSVPRNFQTGINTFEEPFQINSDYAMGNLLQGVQMNVETRCTVIVIVGNDLGMPLTGIFDFPNPSEGSLKLKAEIPQTGGLLRVHSMQGTLLMEKQLDGGLHEQQYDLSQLSNGLYLVSLQGEGWRYPTKRWVIQR
ncbi:MAG: T9SS type A sorting domain-containing protein [Bacteroidia bacterium]|nr:T9SS type A sorting domain-containing protein [Bacteroidia bacterium]